MSIVASIRQAASLAPQVPALTFAGGKMEYGELLARVDALAADLREHGIGPGCRVAIHLERSPELVIAILASMASGAAYIPLDTAHPVRRLHDMIADSRPELVIGAQDLGGIARLDPRGWPSSSVPFDDVEGDIAYIIYTSGSTGAPKGVVVGHAALENYLRWACAALPAGGPVPLFASMAFDHSVTCVFPPLMRGDTLYLLPPIHEGAALARHLLNGSGYSVAKITPAHCRLLDADERAALGQCAKLVMFGGEPLSWELVRAVRRDNPRAAIMNHYGPTETTVACCVYEVPADIEGRSGIVPIGRPIPGVRVSVRADDGRVVLDGESGELWVSGDGLAQGYWGQPDRSADAFVTTDEGPGRRLRWYRTKDLVRASGDWPLEYLGRLDNQVKILGVRVEPREVERALTSHPSVTDAAVVAWNGRGVTELVAGVTITGPRPSEAELRAHVAARLPAAMMPSMIVVLDRLPVTVNGKVDREAILAAVGHSAPVSDAGTAIDAALVAGWFARALRRNVGRSRRRLLRAGR